LEFTEWFSSHLPLPMALANRVFLHQSCSARQLGILPNLKHLLTQIAHLEPLEISTSYSCCGFGGLFSIKCPELSRTMSLAYLGAALSHNPTALVSPDVGCLLHLQETLRNVGRTMPMYHIAELICQSLKTSEGAFSPNFS
jgi:L-lactate dehydrogenase complex protein LldE